MVLVGIVTGADDGAHGGQIMGAGGGQATRRPVPAIATQAVVSSIIVPIKDRLDAFALRGRRLALPAQVDGQERDRVGRLLWLEFDGTEPDCPVIAES